ncbi:MAG: hypothetical protein ACOYJ2_07170 [Rickettsiales bacterium]
MFSQFRQNIDVGGLYSMRQRVSDYITSHEIYADELAERVDQLDENRDLEAMHAGLTEFFGDSVIAREFMTLHELDDWTLHFMLGISDDYVPEHDSFTREEHDEVRNKIIDLMVAVGVNISLATVGLKRFEEQVRAVSQQETGLTTAHSI